MPGHSGNRVIEVPGEKQRDPSTGQSGKSIGLFDSGIGGLTVMKAVREALPGEDLIYFGDNARVPYGTKSPETINRYAGEITGFLLAREVKLLIVACNTMSAVARETISGRADIPVLDVIEAGARLACGLSQKKRIGVIGTQATINSGSYLRAIRRWDDQVQVISRACPLFVPLVEEGWLNHPAARLTAEEYLRPLLAWGIDALVLGCTHYPLLKPLLREVLGPGVALVDSAAAVAQNTRQKLAQLEILRNDERPGKTTCYCTEAPELFRTQGEAILGVGLAQVELVEL